MSQAFLFLAVRSRRKTFPRDKTHGQDSHLPNGTFGVKLGMVPIQRSMRFPATIVILLLLLLQTAGVASSSGESYANSSANRSQNRSENRSQNQCCSSRSQAFSLPETLPSPAAEAPDAGPSSQFYAQVEEGSACCSGCRCDVQEQPAPAGQQEPPCAPSPHARTAAPAASGATVAILPPPTPVHSRSSDSAWARTTLFKSPFKRASLNVLHCAFLI